MHLKKKLFFVSGLSPSLTRYFHQYHCPCSEIAVVCLILSISIMHAHGYGQSKKKKTGHFLFKKIIPETGLGCTNGLNEQASTFD